VPEPFDIARLGLDKASEIHALLERCPDIEPRRYKDGESLMREGEESLDLFIVLDGAYVVERPAERPGDPAMLLALVSVDPGNPSIVGEMAYFGAQPRSASVRCSGRTHALCLRPNHIETIVESFPGLLKIIFRQFAHRLAETNQALKSLQDRLSMPAGRRMASAGERLFSAGDPASTLFQLVFGEVRLDDASGSRILKPEDLPEGFLELASFLKGEAFHSSAIVEGSSMVVTVEAAHRETFVRNFPRLVLECLAGPDQNTA